MDQAELDAAIAQCAPADLRLHIGLLTKLVGKRQAAHVIKLLMKAGMRLVDEKTARRGSPQGGPDGPSG